MNAPAEDGIALAQGFAETDSVGGQRIDGVVLLPPGTGDGVGETDLPPGADAVGPEGEEVVVVNVAHERGECREAVGDAHFSEMPEPDGLGIVVIPVQNVAHRDGMFVGNGLPAPGIGDLIKPEMVVLRLVGPAEKADADLEEGSSRGGRVEAGDAEFFRRALDVVVPEGVARLQPGGAELFAEKPDGGEDARMVEAGAAVIAALRVGEPYLDVPGRNAERKGRKLVHTCMILCTNIGIVLEKPNFFLNL